MLSISDVLFDGRAQRAAEALSNNGYTVKLVGFTREAGLPEALRETNPRYQLLRLRLDGLGQAGRIFDRVFFSFWAFLQLAFSRWDVIHLHEPHFLPVGSLLSRLRGGHLVYDVRELYQSRFGRDSFEGKLERRWQSKADALVITSRERSDHFFGVFDRMDRPAVVVRNLPRKHSTSRRIIEEAGKEGLPRFVYHGRLSRANRHLEEMILAFQGLDAWLHIMGADSQGTRAELEALVVKENMDNVSFHEPCAPQELIAICEGIDAGFMPYRDVDDNTALANPTKMAEYAGAGMALISSEFPLMREAIDLYGVGLITRFDDSESLHGVLTDLVVDRELLNRMKAGSQNWYKTECDWENESPIYLELYRDLERMLAKPNEDAT